MTEDNEFFERMVVYEDGRIEKIRVPKKEVLKEMEKMLEEDKEMLEILAKL